MEVSDWVKFRHNNIDRIGYIVEISGTKHTIYQTYPKLPHAVSKQYIYDNGSNITLQTDTSLVKSEVATLIDAALAMKDEPWFMELTNKMKNGK